MSSNAASEPTACAVGVDWGTTRRRGYALDAGGRCIAEVDDGDGLLAARGRFPQALAQLLAALGAGAVRPVVLSGMVGSAQGWVQAPYLDIDVPLVRLRDHRVDVPEAGGGVCIVPGYALRREGQVVDVMRGEETQLLGAVALGHEDGWFVLPGTHSKWVRLQAGAIADFATYMTGELFALLATQGTLAAAIGEDAGVDDAGAFAEGVAAAADTALSHALFGVRGRVVGGALPADRARSYLSGVLIGAEWHDLRRRCGGRLPREVTAIGAPELAERHAEVAKAFGIKLHRLDARAVYLAALARLLA